MEETPFSYVTIQELRMKREENRMNPLLGDWN